MPAPVPPAVIPKAAPPPTAQSSTRPRTFKPSLSQTASQEIDTSSPDRSCRRVGEADVMVEEHVHRDGDEVEESILERELENLMNEAPTYPADGIQHDNMSSE